MPTPETILTLPMVLSIGGVIVSAVMFVIGYFKFMIPIFERLVRIETFEEACNLKALNLAFAKMETKMEVMWDPIVRVLAQQIKQPIHLRKDELLDNLSYNPKSMTKEDLAELNDIIQAEENGKPKEEHLKYALLRGRIASLLLDKE